MAEKFCISLKCFKNQHILIRLRISYAHPWINAFWIGEKWWDFLGAHLFKSHTFIYIVSNLLDQTFENVIVIIDFRVVFDFLFLINKQIF